MGNHFHIDIAKVFDYTITLYSYSRLLKVKGYAMALCCEFCSHTGATHKQIKPINNSQDGRKEKRKEIVETFACKDCDNTFFTSNELKRHNSVHANTITGHKT